MSEQPYKMQVKIGDSEFCAEGPEATVNQQFQLFLQALRAAPPVAPSNPPPASLKRDGQDRGDGSDSDGGNGLSADLLGRAYDASRDDLLSLHGLPQGEHRDADALLMLLYGYEALKETAPLLGTQLAKAAKQSGLQLDRVDRVIGRRTQFVNSAGQRRGKKYSLNNLGKKHVESIIRQLFE